jgi:hypothetical protein
MRGNHQVVSSNSQRYAESRMQEKILSANADTQAKLPQTNAHPLNANIRRNYFHIANTYLSLKGYVQTQKPIGRILPAIGKSRFHQPIQ